MTKTHQLKSLVDHLEEGILAMLLAFMTCLTFVQVVLRYIFNSGLVWSLEATTYSFAWLMLIGISYGVRTRAHITVDLVTSRLTGNKKRFILLLAVVMCVVYAGLMFYGSFVFVERLFMLGNFARDIVLPKWLLTAIMPVGFALLAFRFIQVGLGILRDQSSDTENDDHAELMATDNEPVYVKGSE